MRMGERRRSPFAAGRGPKSAPLVAALATNTAYGYFGFALVARALDVLHGAHRHIHTLAPPDLGTTGELPVLITTDRPESALSHWLVASGAPILAFFDAPENLVAHALFCDGETFAASLRRAAHGVACLSGCAQASALRVFEPGWRRAEVRELAAGVLDALGASSAHADEVTARVLAGEGLSARATVAEVLRRRHGGEALAQRAQRFSDAERALLRDFAAQYGPLLTGGATALDWPRALFVADPGEAGDRDVEMIGPPRHLVWGPYLHLPLGRWRADVQFEVEGNISGNVIEADVSELTTRSQLARCVARLPERGLFGLTLDFDNPSPDAPLEIRVRLMESAIEGRFGLRRVRLTPGGLEVGLEADFPGG